MKRKTILSGDGKAGKLKITIESVADKTDLTRDEHAGHHDLLTEKVLLTMADQGCYAHKVKVSK